jgi:hypothetical protein
MNLRKFSLIVLLITLSACAAPTPEIIEQTKIVEQTVEVTKIVQITETPEPTLTPTPPAPILVEDDFEDGTGWWGIEEYPDSAARIENSKLIIDVSSPNYYHIVGNEEMDPMLEAYDMAFVTELLDGAADSNLIIDFRWSDSANYAEISISGDRYLALGIYFDNEYFSIIPWTRMRAINSGPNEFRLIDFGNRIVLYANDNLLLDMPFENFGFGSIGFGIETWDSGGAIWSFDDFVVREVE